MKLWIAACALIFWRDINKCVDAGWGALMQILSLVVWFLFRMFIRSNKIREMAIIRYDVQEVRGSVLFLAFLLFCFCNNSVAVIFVVWLFLCLFMIVCGSLPNCLCCSLLDSCWLRIALYMLLVASCVLVRQAIVVIITTYLAFSQCFRVRDHVIVHSWNSKGQSIGFYFWLRRN